MADITFHDVPRKEGPTFLFIPAAIAGPLEYALKLNRMTGWEIKTIVELEHVFSEAAAAAAKKVDPAYTLVLVSRFDTGAMCAKLDDLSQWDGFAKHEHDERIRESELAAYKNAWKADPPPFGLSAPQIAYMPQGLFRTAGLPRHDKPTFLFFATAHRRYVNCALQSARETGWAVTVPAKIKDRLPDGFIIPEVRLHPGAPRIERNVSVLVSNLDAGALSQQLKFTDMRDPVNRHLTEIARKAAEDMDYDDAWTKDPPPSMA